MPVILVTRLGLRDPAVFDGFFASAVAVVEQAQGTKGNLMPDWQEGHRRLVADGQATGLPLSERRAGRRGRRRLVAQQPS